MRLAGLGRSAFVGRPGRRRLSFLGPVGVGVIVGVEECGSLAGGEGGWAVGWQRLVSEVVV